MGQVPASRMARRVRKEARALVREARSGLSRHGYRLPAPIRQELELATQRVAAAADVDDDQLLRRELVGLDELVDEHLAFARKSTGREYAESIGIAVLIALLARGFVVEAFKIPSGSMIPTMEIGDHIFVNKIVFGLRVPFTETKVMSWRDPRPGEVVVFRDPCDADTDFIKRVVAVEGDVVEVRCNRLYVNGALVASELVGEDVPYFNTGSVREDGCTSLDYGGWQRCYASEYLAHQGGHDYHTYYSAQRPVYDRGRSAAERTTNYWSYMPGDGRPIHRTVHDFPELDTNGALSSADALVPDGEPSEPPGADRLAAVVRLLEGTPAEVVARELSEQHRGRSWCFDTLEETDESGETVQKRVAREPCFAPQDVRAWMPVSAACDGADAAFVRQLRPAPADASAGACGPKLGYEVPPGHLWAMGDNREKSADSRTWGPVPLANVKGKALFIWWSSQPGQAAGRQWHRVGKIVH